MDAALAQQASEQGLGAEAAKQYIASQLKFIKDMHTKNASLQNKQQAKADSKVAEYIAGA